jgi:hypothetical protein
VADAVWFCVASEAITRQAPMSTAARSSHDHSGRDIAGPRPRKIPASEYVVLCLPLPGALLG